MVGGGSSPEEVVSAMAELHVRHDLFPGDELIGLTADAIRESGATREQPLDGATLYDKFLPERAFSGKTQRTKSSYALRAAAMIASGVEPDLADDAGWYQADDFWVYATFAFVTYVRAAADRTGRS